METDSQLLVQRCEFKPAGVGAVDGFGTRVELIDEEVRHGELVWLTVRSFSRPLIYKFATASTPIEIEQGLSGR